MILFKKQIALASITFIAISLLFFAYQESWVIFMIPHKKKVVALSTETKPTEAILYFWKHDKCGNEQISYIKSSDPAQNINHYSSLFQTFR